MITEIKLEGKSARSQRFLGEHGEWWYIKEENSKWFTGEIRGGKALSHYPGIRLEAARCSCQTCIRYSPISHWIYKDNDSEYKIVKRKKVNERKKTKTN